MDVVKALGRPSEFWAMVRAKRTMGQWQINVDESDVALQFCYEKLKAVSRSFAMVIMQLNGEVRDAVAIFYLVLRALDTIEDDMSVPVATKVPELLKFYQRLDEPTWTMEGVGKGAEMELLQHYYHVTEVYNRLRPGFQKPIADICKRMGEGMAHYITLEGNVETCEQYDKYCHYVAGLVGHGLSALFGASDLEDPSLANELEISNLMGLFLQKTNIIRDYLEDIMESPPRMFWPKDIWCKFTDDFHAFKEPANIKQALACLNAMILNALQHVEAVLQYLSMLKDPSVFRFCAIPQVMAIATLVTLYNNPNVFKGVVKIRKGQACQIMLDSGDMVAVRKWFQHFFVQLNRALDHEDPSFEETREKLRSLYIANRDALRAEGADEGSMTRSMITEYGPLGGSFLYSLIDTVSSMWKSPDSVEGFDD
jgi:farnesyl-diphosphate farnesyltransferase